jgi:putative flippase GtrA
MATKTDVASRIPSSKGGRFLGFLAVGATGLVINQLAFWMLTDVFGLYYLWGFLLATQFSTAWNFVLLERYVFEGRREGRWARLSWYALMNNIWNVASAPVMYAITTGLKPLDLGHSLRRRRSVRRRRWLWRRRRCGRRAGQTPGLVAVQRPRHRADRLRDAAAGAGALRGA